MNPLLIIIIVQAILLLALFGSNCVLRASLDSAHDESVKQDAQFKLVKDKLRTANFDLTRNADIIHALHDKMHIRLGTKCDARHPDEICIREPKCRTVNNPNS